MARKATFLAVAAAFAMTGVASADLLITEVVDATLAGGNPKYVEVTNTGPAPYTFADGGIIVQSNANTDYNVDVDLTGVTIAVGQSYVIQSSANDGQLVFETTYGFAADLYTTAFFGNGDDRYILTDTSAGDGSGLLDIYGADGVDGSGEAWEYTDSYAARVFGTSSDGGAFNIGNWIIPGPNALEDPGFDDVIEAQLIVANTSPGVWVPEPATALLLALGGVAVLRRRS